jgi:hypothetical protein
MMARIIEDFQQVGSDDVRHVFSHEIIFSHLLQEETVCLSNNLKTIFQERCRYSIVSALF